MTRARLALCSDPVMAAKDKNDKPNAGNGAILNPILQQMDDILSDKPSAKAEVSEITSPDTARSAKPTSVKQDGQKLEKPRGHKTDKNNNKDVVEPKKGSPVSVKYSSKVKQKHQSKPGTSNSTSQSYTEPSVRGLVKV